MVLNNKNLLTSDIVLVLFYFKTMERYKKDLLGKNSECFLRFSLLVRSAFTPIATRTLCPEQ